MLNDLTSNFYSLIIGGLFSLVLYHLLIFLQARKKVYLYYSGYMICLAIYFVFFNLKSSLPHKTHAFSPLLLAIGGGFYMLFTRSIVSLQNYSKKWDKILKNGAIVCFISGIFLIVIYYFFGREKQIVFFKIFALAFNIYSLFIFWVIFKIKTIYSKYFLLGSLTYFILVNITYLSEFFISVTAFKETFGFELLFFTFLAVTIEALVFASLIGYKVKENEKEKIIAQENQKLEKEKVMVLLKEQEINAINAMISGQEKERQRLAIELHDSVGSTLSAAKLQFEHLKKNRGSLNNEEELFKKTSKLLENAYQEVRSIAHSKNSGVIAKFGLLPAIEKLAKNVSGTNKLTLEVQDFGLTKRIDNTLEITIFRIIQELVTNIIKHANATEANISLTQHENILSIIVEDSGIGFDAKKISKKEGMGLSSIEKRIKHIGGTMEVDSAIGKGASILIDIPI